MGGLKVKTFRRSYRAFPAGPTPLDPTPPNPSFRTRFRPDFDLILTRFGPEIRLFGSKSGLNWVRNEGFGGGRVQRGRSGWEGSAAPRESLELKVLVHNCPRSPSILVILRRKFPLERGPKGPQGCPKDPAVLKLLRRSNSLSP